MALASALALITPALFSQPSTRPDGEKREWLVGGGEPRISSLFFSPLSPAGVGGGLGERGRGSEGPAPKGRFPYRRPTGFAAVAAIAAWLSFATNLASATSASALSPLSWSSVSSRSAGRRASRGSGRRQAAR